MYTLVTFIVSLVLIITLVLIKNIEISHGQTFLLTRLFTKGDASFLRLFAQIKSWLSRINFSNFKLIFSRIAVSIRNMITAFKRRFDHKQSYFFTKRDHDASKNKGSVSFFLKDISAHKKSLRENKEE